MKLYHEHVEGQVERAHRGAAGGFLTPRVCTPADDLPEGLR